MGDFRIDVTFELRRAMGYLGADPDQLLVVGTTGEPLLKTFRSLGAPQELLDLVAEYGRSRDIEVLARLRLWNAARQGA